MQNRVQNKSNVTNRPAQFSWTLAEMKFNKIDKVSVFFCKCLNQEEIFCLNHLLLCWFRFARGNKKSVGLLYSLKFFSFVLLTEKKNYLGEFSEIYFGKSKDAKWNIYLHNSTSNRIVRNFWGKEKLFNSRRFELIVDFSGLFMLCRK